MAVNPNAARPRTSTRDRDELQQRLSQWLCSKLGENARLSDLASPKGTGMSSETLMFDVAWNDAGTERSLKCVARLPPDQGAVPVFPEYDLLKQFKVMQLARERSDAPIPGMLWYESDESWLGAPFFVMERASGEAATDIPPYVFDSWLLRAEQADRARLQRNAIGVLAKLHGIVLSPEELEILRPRHAGTSALRRHVTALRAFHDWVIADGAPSPLLERAFAWIDTHWPENEGQEVLNWGDARLGNILFVDFEPVAVLDWEMVGTGPRELDLAWMIFMHHFFQDYTPLVGVPGLPDMMRLDEACACYEQLSGHRPRDMAFYTLCAALRHGIVMFRIGRRQAHFGEAPIPEDPDDMIPHRAAIEAMLAGSYWETRR